MTPLHKAYWGFALIGICVVAAFVSEQVTGHRLSQWFLTDVTGIRRHVEPDTAHAIPETVPHFVLNNLKAERVDSDGWRGRPLILNFWASWCGPCRHEIPLLNQAAQASSLEHLQVVGVAIDFKEDVAKFLQQTPVSYPVLIGEEDGLELAHQLGIDSLALPFTVFADSQGHVLAIRLGELHEAQLVQVFALMHALEAKQLPLADARAQIRAVLDQPATSG
jgi:thiol-disulfide isomerase/thioredoxin